MKKVSDKKNSVFACIHGHFYQPPRENAWLDTILMQKSAFPFHNWNERINAECYMPNSQARLLNEKGQIIGIRNNFEDISFNIGPTLLAWLEKYDSRTYERILEADWRGAQKYQFAGPAIAQVYNHIIMPLASDADKLLQIKWGIKDFSLRFGRNPEGMWLAETAVDTATLEILADQGIRFTILAPWQAQYWYQTTNHSTHYNSIESNFPYRCLLPSGNEIMLFFYNGQLAGDIAFGNLLSDGRKMADTISEARISNTQEAQLIHIATDGETFGHHHRFGEMALASCLFQIEKSKDLQIMPYGAFLNQFPTNRTVEIKEKTSWSCMHGIERWRSDCGCKTGGEEHWNQRWRSPLRRALNDLKMTLDSLFDHNMITILPNYTPSLILEAYIEVFQSRTKEKMHGFARLYGITDHKTRRLFFRLLEMQRHSQLMFTSCAWFFNEISGIETTQVLQYACRAIQLYILCGGEDPEPHFLKILAEAQSNDTSLGSAADIYCSDVKPLMLTMEQVGMHFAAHYILLNVSPKEVLNYTFETEEWKMMEADHCRLLSGVLTVQSTTTLHYETIYALILHHRNFALSGIVFNEASRDTFDSLSLQINQQFLDGHYTLCKNVIENHKVGKVFSFDDLIYDEKVFLVETRLKQINHLPLGHPDSISYETSKELTKKGFTLPLTFKNKAFTYLNDQIWGLLECDDPYMNIPEISSILSEFTYWNFALNSEEYKYAFNHFLNNLTLPEENSPIGAQIQALSEIGNFLELLKKVNIEVNAERLTAEVFLRITNNEIIRTQRNYWKSIAEYLNILVV
jgi:alpha-amylase/alpha-mannosidase (GH57 family)